METIKGYVEKIVYRNDENGYTVLDLDVDGDSETCVGSFHVINEGEYIEVSGEYKEHKNYGPQLLVSEYKVIQPEDEISIIRYLSSGVIKGIRESTATKIVNRFGKDTFRIMEEEPERLAEIRGISEKKAMEISGQMEEKREMRSAMMFLSDYPINMQTAVRIYNYYGNRMYEVIRTNPYKMAEEIDGIGFKIADEIAKKSGISPDSDFRIESGILYALSQALLAGSVYLPANVLLEASKRFLEVDELDFDRHIMNMSLDKRIICKGSDIYQTRNYYTELTVAKSLADLNQKNKINEEKILARLKKIEKKENIVLDEIQELAVVESVRSGLLIITGGPGTGKTTTINMIIKYFEEQDAEILLAAPTGRAAKRMFEATGREAQTIHRLLSYNGNPEEEGSMKFEKNSENPLEADLIIIDETSMVDIFLMNALLKAVMPGTRLILVGDVNQLESVGAGKVMEDMINSNIFNVVKLEKIFRQAAESDIVTNAHKINKGQPVDHGKRSRDFLFIKRDTRNQVMSAILALVRDKLPGYVEADMNEVQIITPTRKGVLGVEKINETMQYYLNPPTEDKQEKQTAGVTFREGDKVMQIKNDYQIEWEMKGKYDVVLDKGMGVFNGEVGIINKINNYTEMMEVEFDDRKCVTYTFKQLDELELAYAITVHKAQGSEYPAVVIPLFQGPQMLMTRNLLYTAVTRAKKCVCLVGDTDVFDYMEGNNTIRKRYTGLKERLMEVNED
ncbi:MAG: ATP-dependent RecD-like DNA helicase [Lachnospiraceae bacterium]|nr:ATP-dependent RecD-like DNA helicase [Lachnospiraceae bacterium]